MNNVKNDERYFILEAPNKPFSKKLNEEEYNKEFDKADCGLYRFDIDLSYTERMKQQELDKLQKEKLRSFKFLMENLKHFLRDFEVRDIIDENKKRILKEFEEAFPDDASEIKFKNYEERFFDLMREYSNMFYTHNINIIKVQRQLEYIKKNNEKYIKEVMPMI